MARKNMRSFSADFASIPPSLIITFEGREGQDQFPYVLLLCLAKQIGATPNKITKLQSIGLFFDQYNVLQYKKYAFLHGKNISSFHLIC